MTTDTKLAPTDAEIDAIVYEQTGFDGDGTQPMTADEMRRVTRAVLARWGEQQVPAGYALVPVEVRNLYDFMCTAFVPVTWQHDQIAISLDLAKAAMLSAAPQPVVREPLTDEQIHAIYDEVARREPYAGAVTRRSIVRAIEAAHGIKGGQHGTE